MGETGSIQAHVKGSSEDLNLLVGARVGNWWAYMSKDLETCPPRFDGSAAEGVRRPSPSSVVP